jgi:hypothetical protein
MHVPVPPNLFLSYLATTRMLIVEIGRVTASQSVTALIAIAKMTEDMTMFSTER